METLKHLTKKNVRKQQSQHTNTNRVVKAMKHKHFTTPAKTKKLMFPRPAKIQKPTDRSNAQKHAHGNLVNPKKSVGQAPYEQNCVNCSSTRVVFVTKERGNNSSRSLQVHVCRWPTQRQRGARKLQTRKEGSLLPILTAAATSRGSSGWRNFLQKPRESKLSDLPLLLHCILDLLRNATHTKRTRQTTRVEG